MHQHIISMICIALVAGMLIGTTIAVAGCRQNAMTIPDEQTEAPVTPSDIPATTEPDTPSEPETALLPECLEDWFVPQPVPEWDEGNEIYLNPDVIEKLSALEKSGEEDLVNAILDGEILLINHFVKLGYTTNDLYRIQQFYYTDYDRLKNDDFDTLIGKIVQSLFESEVCQ